MWCISLHLCPCVCVFLSLSLSLLILPGKFIRNSSALFISMERREWTEGYRISKTRSLFTCVHSDCDSEEREGECINLTWRKITMSGENAQRRTNFITVNAQILYYSWRFDQPHGTTGTLGVHVVRICSKLYLRFFNVIFSCNMNTVSFWR